MKYDDLSFSLINDDGEEIVCDILSVIPNEENSNEPYVLFTDYMLDENKRFVTQYGKIVEENDEYILKSVTDEIAIEKIKNAITHDIISYAKDQI